jgi:serine/threonine protein kinase
MDVSEQLANAGMISNLYKEGENLKKLNHKNIVQLDHCFLEGKQLIMIMELIGGGEVYQYLEEHTRLDEYSARKIMLQIANAIMYCHSRGVVHRDLKLENVMFRSKEDLFIKVLDFGIAGVCAGN